MSGNHKHTTVPEHMPSSHRRYAGWTIERIRAGRRRDRAGHRRAVRPDPRRAPASRAGLPRLSRHHPARRVLRRRAARGRRHAGDRHRRAHLRLGQIDPRQQPRSASAHPSAPRTTRRSSIPTSAGRATTIRRSRLAHPSDPRSAPRARPCTAWPRPSSTSKPAARPQASATPNGSALLLEREASLRRDKRLVEAAALRQAAPAGLRRGHRLSHPARPRPRAVRRCSSKAAGSTTTPTC